MHPQDQFLDAPLIQTTVKLVYNDHPWDPKFVYRWSLFRGKFVE